jgi:hypothetical protein
VAVAAARTHRAGASAMATSFSNPPSIPGGPTAEWIDQSNVAQGRTDIPGEGMLCPGG